MAIYGDDKHNVNSEYTGPSIPEQIVSDKEYIEQSGGECIYCKSEEISGTSEVDFDDIYAYRKIVCQKCEAEWEEVFTMTSTQPVKGE